MRTSAAGDRAAALVTRPQATLDMPLPLPLHACGPPATPTHLPLPAGLSSLCNMHAAWQSSLAAASVACCCRCSECCRAPLAAAHNASSDCKRMLSRQHISTDCTVPGRFFRVALTLSPLCSRAHKADAAAAAADAALALHCRRATSTYSNLQTAARGLETSVLSRTAA